MVDINELKYYGQWYDSDNEDFHMWWYSVYDEKVYRFDELMEHFSFERYEDIIEADGYIPLWKTNFVRVAREFLTGLKNEKVDKFLQEYPGDEFYGYFEWYTTSTDNHIITWWYEYEDSALTNDAIKWCRKHGIPYKKQM